MPDRVALNDAAVEAAADRLDAIGRHHNWWSKGIKPRRQLDPIGREEFLATVAAVIEGYELKIRELSPDGKRV